MKYARIILLSLILNCIQMQAQSNGILLDLKNIYLLNNDTLYVNYVVRNLTSNKFVLYNLTYVLATTRYLNNNDLYSEFPGVAVLLLNEKHTSSNVLRSRTYPFYNPESNALFFSNLGINECYILNPYDSVEYKIPIDIYSFDLKKGKYKIQLKYHNNETYLSDYNKQNRANQTDCIYFKGVVKSNVKYLYLEH